MKRKTIALIWCIIGLLTMMGADPINGPFWFDIIGFWSWVINIVVLANVIGKSE